MTTAVEKVVSMPIINPDTGRSSRTFVYMGKVDRVEGSTVVDWKGVSDIARFIKQTKIGFQGELYAAAMEAAGHTITEIEYRLICRPTIQFREAKRTWACMKDGCKNATRVFHDEKLAKAFAATPEHHLTVVPRVDGDVDRDAYEQRCVEWIDCPDYKMRISPFPYFTNSSKLLQAKWYLWESSKRLLENRRCNRWLPSVGSCFAYERECPYAELCEALQNGADYEWAINEHYTVQASSHPELEGADDDSKDVLTYSSLDDQRRCELLYYWKHERRLRKGTGDDTEPLWVGSAMHAGLKAYATGGPKAAFQAIDDWDEANPVLGEDAARRQDTQVAKARGMVRAAVARWPIDSQPSRPGRGE